MPIPAKKEAEAPKTAKQRVFEGLRDWIIDGTLQPGERLIDTEISEYFSVSRTPVREAIQMLADQKLVEVFPGRESRVSQIGSVDIPETYRMIAELHALSVEFAFDKITDADIDALRDANNALVRAYNSHDLKGCRMFDKSFHDIFLKLADNDFLSAFCLTLNGHVSRVENIYFSKISGMDELIKEHIEIISALEVRDLDKAMEYMRANWLHTPEVLAGK